MIKVRWGIEFVVLCTAALPVGCGGEMQGSGGTTLSAGGGSNSGGTGSAVTANATVGMGGTSASVGGTSAVSFANLGGTLAMMTDTATNPTVGQNGYLPFPAIGGGSSTRVTATR